MAEVTNFKNYQRGKRQLTSEISFSRGIQYHSNLVDEGYMKMLVNFDTDERGKLLRPRPGLKFSKVLLPEVFQFEDISNNPLHASEAVSLIDIKECVEGDNTHLQLILGSDVYEDYPRIHVLTVPNVDLSLTEWQEYLSAPKAYPYNEENCYFGNSAPRLTKIHDWSINNPIAFYPDLPGAFVFNNNYYFLGASEDPSNSTYKRGLYYTEFDSEKTRYFIKKVIPKSVGPSEAVTYGYNMLLGGDAYAFSNNEYLGLLQFTGILPYSSSESNKLLMTPRSNEDVLLKCYFNGTANKSYKFVWEWRHVGEDAWTSIQSDGSSIYTLISDAEGKIRVQDEYNRQRDTVSVLFKAPTKDILVRVQAFSVDDEGNVSDTVEKAMTVGFDFTLETYGEAANVEPETYDLLTCRGIEAWQNRIVLYGLPEDPTTLFISEANSPDYFPYPNNISIYEEPIISVKAFMGGLLVFTTSKIHYITLNEDGTTWTSNVIQSNLHISSDDKHLIQVVKNMVYFKAGNYYFMIVPKAQSTTGELVLAPISTEITSFLNSFKKNVKQLMQDTYDYSGELALVDYYNYLNYEDICNTYVLQTEDFKYLSFVLLYNVSTRSWRSYVYESAGPLYPLYRDAAQKSDLITLGKLREAITDYTIAFAGFPNLVGERTKEVFASGVKLPFNQLNSEDAWIEVSTEALDFTNSSLLKFAYKETEDSGELVFTTSDDEHELRAQLLVGDEYQVTIRDLTEYASFYIKSPINIQVYRSYSDKAPLIEELEIQTFNPMYPTIYYYDMVLTDSNRIKSGSKIYLNDREYTLVLKEGSYPSEYIPEGCDDFTITVVIADDWEISGYNQFITLEYLDYSKAPMYEPYLTIRDNVLENEEQFESFPLRMLQIYEYDELSCEDDCFPSDIALNISFDEYKSVYYSAEIKEIFETYKNDILTFNNWQYLDTGFRRDVQSRNKRYREVQFQLNNVEGKNLNFGLEFQIDGQPRMSYYKHDIEHITDPNDPNYGLIYLQNYVDMNIPITYIKTPGETILGPGDNSWTLNQSLFPDLSLWKVRASVSGKGTAPRIRLISRNPYKYELLSINWVYRLMNAR